MIQSVIRAILSPVIFVLLGAGLVTMAVVVPEPTPTPMPEPTPQIIIIELTPEPSPTPAPLLPSVAPLPSLVPLPSVQPLPSLIPLPIPLPSLPPLPPAPVCDHTTPGMHKGWENSGRECSGPNPHPALALGLLIMALINARSTSLSGLRSHRG